MEILTLKCEKCGLHYAIDGDDGSFEDYENIDENGVCLSCENELDVKII